MSVLEGRVVAIAGAGGSLGPSAVRAFEQAGAVVSAPAREDVDLLDAAAVERWAAAVAGEEARVDALVHMVGGWRGGTPVGSIPDDDVRWLEDRLLRTVQLVTAAFAAPLAASGRGRFTLVSTPQALRPAAGNAAYAAAKAAAEAWSLAFGAELAEHGGAANIVAVNAIVTPAMRAANPDKAYKTFTDAGDIAAALVYLSSDAAARMRGQRLALHG
jgi:NAD(P)-dependent dehydrogenase (short-subunit alcohol dehydrogenase family)